jgi:phosphonate transport system substrate-binding protein
MLSRRLLLFNLVYLITACKAAERQRLGKLTVGAVSYEDNQSTQQYSSFTNYLAGALKTLVELEPTFNEIIAIEKIKRKDWALVFAPPGLAAIAISEAQYLPLFSLGGVKNTHSFILVHQGSSFKKITDLKNKIIALGQPGSATGYYLPLYNLYGLTLAKVRISPTPKTTLKWLNQGDIDAGALSLAEFDQYRVEFPKNKFRILAMNSVPLGSLLVAPTIERNQQEQIRKVLALASPQIIDAAGYIPNAKIPNYQELIKIINQVRPLAAQLKNQPVSLYTK